MMKGQTIVSNQDAIISDLEDLGCKARAFYFVPQTLGGGGRKWKNIPASDGTTKDLTLEDLRYAGTYQNKIINGLLPLSQNKFILEFVNDTTLTITGIGNAQTENENFQNKDGQKAKVQVTATITPNTHVRTEIDNPQ